jgi:hypothetical protein
MVKKKQRAKKPRLSTDITAKEFAELGADFFNRVPVATNATSTVDGKHTFVPSQKFALMHGGVSKLTILISMHQMTRLLSPVIFFGLYCSSRPTRQNQSLRASVEE